MKFGAEGEPLQLPLHDKTGVPRICLIESVHRAYVWLPRNSSLGNAVHDY
jgi:hypothetical protein